MPSVAKSRELSKEILVLLPRRYLKMFSTRLSENGVRLVTQIESLCYPIASMISRGHRFVHELKTLSKSYSRDVFRLAMHSKNIKRLVLLP